MSTVQVSDGSSAVTSTSTKNDGGSLAKAGNANTTTGPITKAVTLIEMADDFGTSIGSKVVANNGAGSAITDRAGVNQVVSTRTIAYNAGSTEWIMRGGGVTTTIAGSGYAGFATPGTDFNGAIRDNVHELLTTRQLGTGGGTFDMYAIPSGHISSNFIKGANAGDSSAYIAPSGAGSTGAGAYAATDNAAAPTRSVPGELTYHYGAAGGPTTDEYKAKDTLES
jgi:hypothetical protein